MDLALHQMLSKAREVKLVIDGVVFALLREDLVDVVQITTAPSPNTFRLSGKAWLVQFAGQSCHYNDTVSLRYLHVLLKHQGRSVGCTDIIRMAKGEISQALRNEQIMDLLENGDLSLDSELRTEVLPQEARLRLEAAVEDLQGELESLRENGRADEAMELEEQIAGIRAELQRQQYNGHNVTFATRISKARNTVGNGIRRLIKTIGTENALLASHLTNSIKLGYECCYQPEKPVAWVL